jgi:branched-chain amino acid transport system substrate-binding protein
MKKLVLICFIITSLFLSFCGKKSDVIKIGAIFSITGPASFLGAPEERTAKMMIEQINEAGGINGKKVVLIVKDSAGDSEKAFSFAKQLIEEEKVLAIIGPSTSGETMKIKNLCEQSKVILLSCAAAEAIVKPLAKYVFKTPQTDSDAIKRIYAIMQKKNINKIGVVSSNTGFGNAGKQQLEKIAKEMNIEILISEVYDKNSTDLTDVINKLKAKKVQAVVNWSIEPAQSIIPKNMKQIALNVPLFQSHGFGNIQYVKAAGDAAEGIIFPAGRLLVSDQLPENHPQRKVLLDYKKAYESKYNEEASTFGGFAHDAIILIQKAIEKAGSTETEKVRDALENLKGVMGISGIFNMSPTDHNGLDIDSFETITVKDGKFVIYNQ